MAPKKLNRELNVPRLMGVMGIDGIRVASNNRLVLYFERGEVEIRGRGVRVYVVPRQEEQRGH